MNYFDVIKTAFIFFPLLSLLITLPYILKEYHNYGSVYWFRAVIIYSFILYLLIAFFLVILPLPSIESVASLTTPRTQLIPFAFVNDFINHSGIVFNDIHTYLKSMKSNEFLIPLFNIFLTIPFGAYLHYYYNCNIKKTVLYSFLLSLFFELTQLSGLYFIYPRGYRLFDIDDLILNTFGGFLGYFFGSILLKFLPNRASIDKAALELGKKISFLRRTLAYGIDLFVMSIIYIIIILLNIKINFLLYIIVLSIIITIIQKGQTLGTKFLKIRIISIENELKNWQIILRIGLFYGELIGVPFVLISIYNIIGSNTSIRLYALIIILLCLLVLYLIVFFKAIKNEELFYEKISKTRLKSTIEEIENKEVGEEI